MGNRVNKVRVICKRFTHVGTFDGNEVRFFVTPMGAAAFIFNRQSDMDREFSELAIGNSNAWVTYDIEPRANKESLFRSIKDAMELHIQFYDDGEEAVPGEEHAA